MRWNPCIPCQSLILQSSPFDDAADLQKSWGTSPRSYKPKQDVEKLKKLLEEPSVSCCPTSRTQASRCTYTGLLATNMAAVPPPPARCCSVFPDACFQPSSIDTIQSHHIPEVPGQALGVQPEDAWCLSPCDGRDWPFKDLCASSAKNSHKVLINQRH
uniref:Uncharacterized protein n=1 Tax=Molossus molossus TaxID=27622 RepID=A0A7J8GKR6_MOLMO|nr:hypothetical protein HJG59_011432 [Molossus molossus]